MADPQPGYDAFASYATDPDYRTVRIVERFLESLHTRGGVRKAKLAPLRICVDGSDFSLPKIDRTGAVDPIHAILESYLAISGHLILFCSRGSAASSHVDQEVAYFLDRGRSDAVLCVVTEGADPVAAPEEIFSPRMLASGLHRVPWYDLRGLRGRKAKGWVKVRDADDEMVRLAAHLWGASAGAIYPSWRRARVRTRRLTALAGGMVVVAAVAGTGWFAYTKSNHYALAELKRSRPLDIPATAERVKALALTGELEQAEREILEVKPPDLIAADIDLGDIERATHPRKAREHYERALAAGDCGRKLIVKSVMAGVDRGAIDACITGIDALSLTQVMEAERAVGDLARYGRVDAALHIARKLTGVEQQAAALLAAGAAMADPRAAYSVLRQAEQLAPPPAGGDLPPTSWPSSELVAAYLKIDRPADALRVARSRRFDVRPISRYYIRKGDLLCAAAVLSELGIDVNTAAMSVASILIDEGQLSAARGWIAAEVSQSQWKARLFADLVERAVEKKRLDEVRLTLDQMAAIPLALYSPGTAVTIAAARSALNQPEEGVKVLQAVAGKGSGTYLPRALAQSGLYEKALEVLDGMPKESGPRQSVRRDIVRAMIDAAARRGDEQGVLAADAKIDSRDEALPLREAVRALIAGGHVEAASRVAGRIRRKDEADGANASVAEAWAKNGDVRAVAAAETIAREGGARACALATVAGELQKRKAGAAVVHRAALRAGSAAPESKDQSTHGRTLQCIASGLAAAHETEIGLQVTRAVADDKAHDGMLVAIVEDLAQRGEFRRAKEVAGEIRGTRTRSGAYDAILLATTGRPN